jgi:DNA-binding response OmpR family regulator
MAAIMIVEDEERIASFLTRALSSCGFEVVCAGSAAGAAKLLEEGRYDLILLDLLLPGEDGFTVLERSLDLQPTQEVVILSALSDVESKIKCFELGAADYVTKPFVLAELVARIRIRIRQSRDLAAVRFLETDMISLDLQRRVAMVNGKRFALSTREFDLLAYLMRKMGEVCPREELLASVWGYSFDPGTNVVDVYVRRLREKLGSDVIETVRNVGYSYPSAA